MKTTNKELRKKQIEASAYELLKEKGYKKTSMLAIAKKASASNETLYSWYGNKQNLFASLVKQNAKFLEDLLLSALEKETDVLKTLDEIGPVLLKLVTNERSIILNRAAAIDADETNTLGKSISEQGRMRIMPLIKQLIEQGIKEQILVSEDAAEITTIYISMLIGDSQIKRVIGEMTELSDKEVDDRSVLALKQFRKLYERDHNNVTS